MDMCLYLYRVYATDPPTPLPCKDICGREAIDHLGVPGITLEVRDYPAMFCGSWQWEAAEKALRKRWKDDTR